MTITSSQIEAVPLVGAERPELRSESSTGHLVLVIGRRLCRHILGSVAVILGVLTVAFFVTHVFAPDPTNLFLSPGGNGFASPQAAAAERLKVRTSLGLGSPLPVQYYHFIDNLLHGNLGVSFQTGRSVTSDLLARLPATAELAVYALVLGLLFGIVFGVVSAVKRESIFDHIVRFFTIGGLSLPSFWVGLMLIWIFTTKLRITPSPIGRLSAGVVPPHRITGFYVIDGLLQGDWSTAADAAAHLVLPVVTLAIVLGAPLSKIIRSSMIEALDSDYIRTATAIGFGRRRIWMVYALKNALLPVLTVLASVVAQTFCGTVLVEGIFGWPGVGNYALQAITTSDFPAVQGFVLYTAIIYIVIYELLDYCYSLADPRIRL
jgi:ABC-type dipeptide/oligopeptide/nickel transport system permease component